MQDSYYAESEKQNLSNFTVSQQRTRQMLQEGLAKIKLKLHWQFGVPDLRGQGSHTDARIDGANLPGGCLWIQACIRGYCTKTSYMRDKFNSTSFPL